MGEQTINFVEGEGISIQAGLAVDEDAWNVEIANLIVGLPGEDGQVLTVDTSTDLGVVFADPVSDPSADTHVWMPLSTVVAGVPELVWDGDDDLIPTLTPLT